MPKIAEVTFRVAINEDATKRDIVDWIEFELNYHPVMPCGNPLDGKSIQPMSSSLTVKVWEAE